MDIRKTFNEDAANYDRFRPRYHPRLFSDIAAFCGLDHSKQALEIGLGTGQATLPFLKTGCNITAVELGEDLAEFSRQKFSEYENLTIINSSFEDFETGTAFDLIYSAMAFHWIKDEIGYPKAHGLLKKGGTLALFWNHPSAASEDDQMHVEIQKVYAKYRPSARPKPHGEEDCRAIAEKIARFGFADVEFRLYHGERNFSAQDYIGLLNTYSDHIALPPEIKGVFEKEIAEAINNLGGTMTVFDTIDLYLAKKP
ncbi:MAG: class I SAM-dependent methyltransferase [Christensenellales bacterium]|jgi:SAM-dependent methyltransferase